MPSLYALCVTLVCTLPSSPSRPASLGWDYPLEGPRQVVSSFAPPPASAPWLRGNRGVDLAATPGALVHAAGAGIVSFAGPLAGRGVVVIVHGELRSTYEPVLASVRAGDRVAAWQPIGRVQAAPSPCPPTTCLHWGLLRGSTYLDPMLLLAGPVRLLPWSSDVAPPLRALVRVPAWGPAPVTADTGDTGVTGGPPAPEPDPSRAPALVGTGAGPPAAGLFRTALFSLGGLAIGRWFVRWRNKIRPRAAPAYQIRQ